MPSIVRTKPIRVILGAALLALGSGGCVNNIAPPPAPQRIVPSIADPPDEPPVAGTTRVVLDSDERGAVVTIVTGTAEGSGMVGGRMATYQAVATKRLCRTPCTADLPRGEQLLTFTSPVDETRASQAEVAIGTKPTIVRHAIGRVEPHPWLRAGGFTLLPVGLIGVLAGAVAVPTVNDLDQRQLAYLSLGAGAGLTVLGVLLLYLGRTDIQSGSTTQWNVDEVKPPIRSQDTSALLVW